MRVFICAFALSVGCGSSFGGPTAASGAEASIASQNLAHRAVLSEMMPRFTCPKSVGEEINKLTAKSPTVSSEDGDRPLWPNMDETAMRTAIQMFPGDLKTNPAAIKMYADAMRIPEEKFRRFLERGPERKRPPSFMSRTSARIAIDNRIASLCDIRCEADVAWNVVTAIALWRNFCMTCSEDFLTVISVGSKHWVDTRVLEWLETPGPKSPAAFPLSSLAPRLMGERQNPAAASARRDAAGRAMSGVFYDLIEDTHPARRALCGQSMILGNRPPALSALQNALCNGVAKAAPVEESKMRFVLTPGATSCGSSEDYVACANTDSSVELTFEGTRLSFFDVFGRKTISVGPVDAPEISGTSVVFHEVGHWFGLPHVLDKIYQPNVVPDVMQGIYLDTGCLSFLSLSLMANMDEELRAKRLNRGAGLRRPLRSGR